MSARLNSSYSIWTLASLARLESSLVRCAWDQPHRNARQLHMDVYLLNRAAIFRSLGEPVRAYLDHALLCR